MKSKHLKKQQRTPAPCLYTTARIGTVEALLKKRFGLTQATCTETHLCWLDTPDHRLFSANLLMLFVDHTISVENRKTPEAARTCPQSSIPKFYWELDDNALATEIGAHIVDRALLKSARGRRKEQVYHLQRHPDQTTATLELNEYRLTQPTLQFTEITCTALKLEKKNSLAKLVKTLQDTLPNCGERNPFEAYCHSHWRPGKQKKTYIKSESPIIEMLCDLFSLYFSQMQQQQSGVVAGTDNEFLHQYRVALRRTRALLKTFRKALPHGAYHYFNTEFRWLGKLTAPIRDQDVLWFLLHEQACGNQALFGDSLEPATTLLKRRRSTLQRHLREALESERYRTLCQQWAIFLSCASTRPDLPTSAKQPAGRQVAALIQRAYKAMLRIGRELNGECPDARLHALRLQGKQFRYLLESCTSLYDKETLQPLVRKLKTLQSTLGDFQDAVVMHPLITDLASTLARRKPLPSETLLSLGALRHQIDSKKQGCREATYREFKAFSDHRIQKLVTNLG